MNHSCSALLSILDSNYIVPLAGIEPAFHPSQGCVLSIERQGLFSM
jgi:hypothetical protein